MHEDICNVMPLIGETAEHPIPAVYADEQVCHTWDYPSLEITHSHLVLYALHAPLGPSLLLLQCYTHPSHWGALLKRYDVGGFGHCETVVDTKTH